MRRSGRKYLPKLATGEWVGCFGLTEPDHGSDPGSMITNAKAVDGGFVLNGAKMWITNSPDRRPGGGLGQARRQDPRLRRRARISMASRPPRSRASSRLRSSITGEIVHGPGVFVPEDNIFCRDRTRPVRDRSAASTKPATESAWGAHWRRRVLLARGPNQYTLDRTQFGRPLAANQLIQKKLADMQTEITVGLQACLRVGRLLDEGRCAPENISLVKRNSCGKALDIARMARDMHGGNGIVDEFHVIRHVMNLETVNTYEGTHDIHALILGRAQTGLQAFTGA